MLIKKFTFRKFCLPISGFLMLCVCLQAITTHASEAYEFERVPDGEMAGILDISNKTRLLQQRRAEVIPNQQGNKLRGVHPKSHGCIAAEFTVNKTIAAQYRVGLFSKPGERFEAVIRFSNAAVTLSADDATGSRGMAVKVLDVKRDVLLSDDGKQNQDFLMINTPEFAFPNVRSYQRLTNALLASPSGADPRAAFSPDGLAQEDLADLQKTFKVIGKIGKMPVRNPLEVQYFAAAPSTFGADRIMKFSVEPCDGAVPQLAFDNVDALQPDYLRAALVGTMSQPGEICYDFKLQVLNVDQVKAHRSTNSSDLVEDATVVWHEEDYPMVKVARLVAKRPQVIEMDNEFQQNCKSLGFNPWHSVRQHRPLGGINRLRKPVYINSQMNRRFQ